MLMRSSSDDCAYSGHKRHKAGDCRHLWHTEWEVTYLVVYDKKADTCTNKKIDTVQKYSLQRHCDSARSS